MTKPHQEIKAKDEKLYVSAIFDCFDLTALGLAVDDNMRAELCVRTLDTAHGAYPGLWGIIVHSDRAASTPARPIGQRWKNTESSRA